MSLLTSADISYMRSVEEQAMPSTATIYRLSYTSTPLGDQDEDWASQGTVSCDVWISGSSTGEKNSDSETISMGDYYISVPVGTDIRAEDMLDIDGVTYLITFVPKSQSWQTNIRVEATNLNNELRVK